MPVSVKSEASGAPSLGRLRNAPLKATLPTPLFGAGRAPRTQGRHPAFAPHRPADAPWAEKQPGDRYSLVRVRFGPEGLQRTPTANGDRPLDRTKPLASSRRRRSRIRISTRWPGTPPEGQRLDLRNADGKIAGRNPKPPIGTVPMPRSRPTKLTGPWHPEPASTSIRGLPPTTRLRLSGPRRTAIRFTGRLHLRLWPHMPRHGAFPGDRRFPVPLAAPKEDKHHREFAKLTLSRTVGMMETVQLWCNNKFSVHSIFL